MQLYVLQKELLDELSTPRTQQIFDHAKRGDLELRQYATVPSVLAALEDQARVGFEAQERLLRALVAQAQAHPEQRLWRRILLAAFLPGLMRIRRHTVLGEHDAHEVEATLWTAFFEVLHGYPLRRPGSVAKGLLRDVGKTYLRALQMAQNAREHQRALVTCARRFCGEGDEVFCFAEHQEPSTAPPDQDDQEEMIAAVRRCPRLAAEDAELIIATDIQGWSIPQYMQRRGLATGDVKADHRERERLARRRIRARERIRHFFRKK